MILNSDSHINHRKDVISGYYYNESYLFELFFTPSFLKFSLEVEKKCFSKIPRLSQIMPYSKC